MRIPSSYPIAARLTRIALAGLLMTACAGCSSALRFDDPFSNPFLGKADTTGSVAKASAKSAAYRSAAPVQGRIAPAAASGRVTSAPLPAPGTAAIQQLRPRAATEAPARKLVTGAPDTTGSIGRKAGVGTAAKAMPGWSTQGGSPVTLGRGETVETVANRYGVPAPVLLHVNGLSHSSQAVPGQKLIIPTYSASRAGLSSDEAGRFAALIAGNPFVIAGAPTHLAFAGDAEDGPRDVLDDRDVAGEKGALSFADQDAAAAAGTRKIRSVSSIAAPISIKPPTAIAAPKPVAAAPVTKAPAVASGPIKAAKPKIDAKVAAKTAPAKLAVKQVAAKPAPAKTTDKKPAHILAAAPKGRTGKGRGEDIGKARREGLADQGCRREVRAIEDADCTGKAFYRQTRHRSGLKGREGACRRTESARQDRCDLARGQRLCGRSGRYGEPAAADGAADRERPFPLAGQG